MPQSIMVHDLYELRAFMGLTQGQAARACGISRSQYYRIETGHQNPSPATLRKLARGLHTTVKRLQRGAPAMPDGPPMAHVTIRCRCGAVVRDCQCGQPAMPHRMRTVEACGVCTATGADVVLEDDE